jgi:hypothetical protein
MEYKEIQTKKGKKVVFCKLDELLMEAFRVNTPEELVNFADPGSGEFICHCPFCKKEGHRKHKLYINDEMEQGFCFVCCRSFINVCDDLVFKTPDLDLLKAGPSYWSPISYLENTEKRSPNFLEFLDSSEDGMRYLLGRHKFLGELSKILGFRYTDKGDVVIPFKYHSDVIYYQIRHIDADERVRYWLPPMPKGTKPPYIIENGNNKKLIICEGVFDAIALLIQAPTFTPVAVLGSTITDYQLNFLREYVPEEIKVYMDDTDKSRHVRDRIKSVINYCPVSIIRSDGTDPEENLKKKLSWGVSLDKLQWIK